MKIFKKGFLLGFLLVIANAVICHFFDNSSDLAVIPVSALVFFAITTMFLISPTLSELFARGFIGLFFMFLIQIALLLFIPEYIDGNFLVVYIGGFYGSMAAIVAGIIKTMKNEKSSEEAAMNNETTQKPTESVPEIKKSLKSKLLIFALVSAFDFILLITPNGIGIGEFIFTLVEIVFLMLLAPDRKNSLLFVPIFIISLGSFLNANNLWAIPNIIVCTVLYASIFAKISFTHDSLQFLQDTVTNVTKPLGFFSLPFRWLLELNCKKSPVIKRVLIALAAALPLTVILIVALSNADMVFSLKAQGLFDGMTKLFNITSVINIIMGVAVGLYMFGVLFGAHTGKDSVQKEAKERKGDLIIINILLVCVLAVYTFFVIIQFKYLFAGATLPGGLTYTEYARKGFFELLALTGVNIAGILAGVRLTKTYSGKWATLAKLLCHYLCAVTVVLLVSSFYRMLLYTNSDGLTRLRFFVLGFLVFEAIGLIITFVYIARPKFNIVLVYTVVALSYYTLLNVVPTDAIIARNQVDKYLAGERDEVSYVFTLSADAVPAMQYLYENTDDEGLKENIERFVTRKVLYTPSDSWQAYNFSVENTKRIHKQIYAH